MYNSEMMQSRYALTVITKVDNQTDWCAGIAVILKHNDNILHREKHIMPTVKQILAQIGGSTIFSKLDGNAAT